MTTVTTTAGVVSGDEAQGCHRFLGVPFAAPPVGAGRWRLPEPPQPWRGTLDCTDYRSAAPQTEPPYDWFGPVPEPRGEDCLYLNVWTPKPDGARRPVMVWIHGGAFMFGSGAEAIYDGEALARSGDVVVVTINYRLGVFGYLQLGALQSDMSHAANLGGLDQVRALEWVRDNIAGFGGDPENVTIFGESAGGVSVTSLIAMPAADGLFHQAIVQSGGDPSISTRAHTETILDRVLSETGAHSLAALEALPTEALLAAQIAVARSAFEDFDTMAESWPAFRTSFMPSHDGVTLVRDGLDAVVTGKAPKVPILTGATADEWNLFRFRDRVEMTETLLIERFARQFPDPVAAIALYREADPELSASDVFAAAITDGYWRQNSLSLAEVATTYGAGAGFAYLVDWRGSRGAVHGIELPLVFGNLPSSPMREMLTGGLASGPVKAVQQSWTSFARTGSPETEWSGAWPAHSPVTGRRLMVFGDDVRLEEPGENARRRLWRTAKPMLGAQPRSEATLHACAGA